MEILKVARVVCKDRAKVRRDYLIEIKAREGVDFAFTPWPVPSQICDLESENHH